MNFEEEIFNKMKISYETLIKYGFKKNGNLYKFSKSFMNDSFKAEIIIDSNGTVTGKVIDTEFGDEYVNFRIEDQVGEFVGQVREEYKSILKDIVNNCCEEQYFTTKQANKITRYIINKYGNKPEFLWDKFPEYGVFRNLNNQKWYGIIMNIDKSKITKDTGTIEIIDLKVPENEINSLLKKNGIYEGYHMNKKNWITIILDDSLKDEEIFKLIDNSYNLVSSPEEWIVPANPKYYDIINCFNDRDIIEWKQSSDIHVGDIVYMYVAEPYSAILYKCRAVEVNIPYDYQDKNLKISKVMKIKLLKKYKENEYTFNTLNEYGIKAIRGPRYMPIELSKIMNGAKL